MITFYAKNLALAATKTGSNENSLFPVSNLASNFRTKVFRSTTNTDNIVFDLGSIEDVDTIAIVDNWKSGFGFTGNVTIEANATDSWSSPAFSDTLTPDTVHGVGIKELSATQSYRFWRLSFTSTLGYVEVSNVFIGTKTAISTNGIDYNWRYTAKDLKKEKKNRYGQKFIDDVASQRILSGLKMSVVNTTELDKLFEVFDLCRTVQPFFVKIGDGSNYILTDEDRLNGQYFFQKEISPVNFTSGFYNVSFNLEEAM